MRSYQSLYFSVLGLGAIALTTLACGGFDVPMWTQPGGPSTDESSLTADEPSSGTVKTTKKAQLDAATPPPDAAPADAGTAAVDATTPDDIGDAGDAGPPP